MLKRVFKAFEYREFRLLWVGACTSSIGTWMQTVAQSWLVFRLSQSAFMLGLDSFLGQIPIFLFSLLGGVIADRMDRRKLLVGSQVVQMTCAFSLAAMFAYFHVQVWEILALSFVVGLAQAFGGPAYQALIPTLVDAKDLPNAIALNSIQFNLARVVGPALGGIALTELGAAWCFSLNGVSFIAVIVSLLALQMRPIPPRSGDSILKSMKEGIAFIRKQPAMEPLICLAFLMTLLGVPLITFLPVVVQDVFHMGPVMGPKIFTLLLCTSGAGAVAGALIVAALGHVHNKGQVALMTLIGLGTLMAAFALSRNLTLSCVLLFLAGAALIGVFAMISSLVQLIAPDQMRGRVMSVYNVAFRGGMPIGSLISGALIKETSVGTVLAANGVLLVLVGLFFLLVQRRVGHL
ncbi:MAG TPA: MFS transporter [Bryobacteraceae bacterium]|nr:MFS transporter [Bryobacteraceae bacterium]